MHLCPNCKKKYARDHFDVCFDCLPSERKEEIIKFRQEEEEDDVEFTRLQYCGNCSCHIEVDQEFFCGLSPTELCNHGLYVEDGVRRFKH